MCFDRGGGGWRGGPIETTIDKKCKMWVSAYTNIYAPILQLYSADTYIHGTINCFCDLHKYETGKTLGKCTTERRGEGQYGRAQVANLLGRG